jgi:hypothetical protein
MALTLQQRIAALLVEVKEFSDEIVRLLKQKAPTSATSDNATTLNGQTPAQIQSPVDTLINNHAARTNNAHTLTPTQLNAYTPAELADLTDPLLRVGLLPLSQFGALSATALTVAYSGMSIVFTGTTPLMIMGKSYSLSAQTIPLTGSPANKTIHVYVTIANELASITLSETWLSENTTRMYIGSVTTNATQITSGTIAKFSKIDNFRLTATAMGASIPSSTGLPTAAGAIPADWKP